MEMEKSGMEMEMEIKMEENQTSTRKKGGFITMPFIIVNEALEKVASFGLSPNMIVYFMNDFHIGVAQGQNILFVFGAATNFLPLLGAFIADSYLGRFLTIGLGSIASLLGMVVIWLTAMIPQLRPPQCNKALKETCKPPTNTQMSILLSSFVLMAIGAGGVRPCSLAFGADQVDVRNNPKNDKRLLEIFFNWYYASFAVAILLALTVIVYIQERLGFKIGFGIPTALMLLSAITFFLASPFYIKQKPTTSLFTSFAQVISAAYKNRKLSFPDDDAIEGAYHRGHDSKFTKPTDKIRCLNKACIIRKPEDISPEGHNSNPWGVCTIEQVEELKAIIKILPIWSSCIMMSINISQGAFGILQARSMDRHLTSKFEIPAGSFGLFTIVGAALWIGLYDRVLLPVASLIRKKPVRIGLKMRMGLGLFCSFLAMVVSAVVEHFRRKEAIKSGFLDNAAGVVSMSALWLILPHALNGMAEAFNAVAQNEFYYSELPQSLSSFAMVLGGLGLAVGSLIATFVLNTVDELTKKGKNGSWFQDNINKGHFESYYWLLVIMSVFNIMYFLVCCWAYGPITSETKDETTKENSEQEFAVVENGNGDKKQEV